MTKSFRSLEERLIGHPQLRERIEALLKVVENSAGNLTGRQPLKSFDSKGESVFSNIPKI